VKVSTELLKETKAGIAKYLPFAFVELFVIKIYFNFIHKQKLNGYEIYESNSPQAVQRND